MARLVVLDTEHGTDTPFLRGILTRSLQEAGMSFQTAYAIASDVRQRLLHGQDPDTTNDTVHVNARTIQAAVIKALRKAGKKAELEHYKARRILAEPVLVTMKDGQTVPFSHGYHQRSLQSCGLAAHEAAAITGRVYQHLLENEAMPIEPLAIDYLTYKLVDEECGPDVSHRYMVWRDFLHSGRPLILLIGGTSGCGKSTVATGVANRLEIVRTQSTDMLREVMRVTMPKRLLPVLHASSFNAWEELPRGSDPAPDADMDALITDGYRAQAELLSVACEAVVQRAMRERVSMILEGIHVHPAIVRRIGVEHDALLVPVMLGVLNPETLRNRLRGRARKAPGRRSKRYLRSFDAIWTLQSYLLSEADREGLAIIRNVEEEQVFLAIMRLILDQLSENFTGTPEGIFSADYRRQSGDLS